MEREVTCTNFDGVNSHLRPWAIQSWSVRLVLWSQIWKQLCDDKPNEDSQRRLGQKEMKEHLRCSDGSGAWVFIWYLFIGIYCWDRPNGLPPGEAALLCLECHCGWTGIWEGQNSWELSPKRGRGGLPQIRGLTPEVASEVTVVRKPYLMMDDEGYRRRGGMYWKKTELNLMGQGFARISGEYVKGCLHSWPHPLPCLHKKLRHLASTRRTSLGFWRQEVDRLILCKLQSWLWGAVGENQPLSGLL